jgi:hypothetical protein
MNMGHNMTNSTVIFDSDQMSYLGSKIVASSIRLAWHPQACEATVIAFEIVATNDCIQALPIERMGIILC